VGAHPEPTVLRLTKFFGKLFLINFAIGVVTGIVRSSSSA
jgi:cytochrome d ubiquinol oxidase subunit I